MLLTYSSTPYHLVKASAWPLFTGFFAGTMLLFTAINFHYDYSGAVSNIFICLFFLVWTMFSWWFDVALEGFKGGHHTAKVRSGLRMAMALFILSEVLFFAGFFWAFFHSALNPVYNIGGVWPPVGIDTISPWGVPLLNTLILLASGATVTKAHYAIQKNDSFNVIFNLDLTLILALLFTKIQVFEYNESTFTIADSIFGSLFYVMTGFHGAHVLIGTIFLFVALLRYESGHFSSFYHFGFEAAIWYWHFVDVIWILLFICLYWWGGTPTIITLYI